MMSLVLEAGDECVGQWQPAALSAAVVRAKQGNGATQSRRGECHRVGV